MAAVTHWGKDGASERPIVSTYIVKIRVGGSAAVTVTLTLTTTDPPAQSADTHGHDTVTGLSHRQHFGGQDAVNPKSKHTTHTLLCFRGRPIGSPTPTR